MSGLRARAPGPLPHSELGCGPLAERRIRASITKGRSTCSVGRRSQPPWHCWAASPPPVSSPPRHTPQTPEDSAPVTSRAMSPVSSELPAPTRTADTPSTRCRAASRRRPSPSPRTVSSTREACRSVPPSPATTRPGCLAATRLPNRVAALPRQVTPLLKRVAALPKRATPLLKRVAALPKRATAQRDEPLCRSSTGTTGVAPRARPTGDIAGCFPTPPDHGVIVR